MTVTVTLAGALPAPTGFTWATHKHLDVEEVSADAQLLRLRNKNRVEVTYVLANVLMWERDEFGDVRVGKPQLVGGSGRPA